MSWKYWSGKKGGGAEYRKIDFLTLGTSRWIGSCIIPTNDGYRMLWCPGNNAQIAEFNPLTEEVTFYGSTYSGDFQFIGCVYHPSGKVVFIPHRNGNIIFFDVNTKAITSITAPTGTNKYCGGVLAQNGFVYGIPFNKDTIVKIDVENETFTEIPYIAGSAKHFSAVLHPNGKIYFNPSGVTNIVELDPVNDSYTNVFTSVPSGSAKYYGANNTLDGRIYFSPLLREKPLIYDPVLNTIEEVGDSLGVGVKYIGGALVTTGNIFSHPHNSLKFLKNNLVKSFIEGIELIGNEKFYGNKLFPNGKIYGVPYVARYTVEISKISSIENNMFELPINLNDLPTSNYNIYQNYF